MRGWTSLFSRLVGRQAEASTSGRCGKGTTAGFTSLSTEGEAPYNPARTSVREVYLHDCLAYRRDIDVNQAPFLLFEQVAQARGLWTPMPIMRPASRGISRSVHTRSNGRGQGSQHG
jgi:hypothetical protein